MTHTPDNPDLAVRALIDRLFDDVEPPHRGGMADVSISHGATTARRHGYTVAGAAACVLAIAAGAVVVANPSGGTGEDWTLGPNPGTSAPVSAYEDPGPTYADKVREIDAELPRLLTPLLPPGTTVRYDSTRRGAVSQLTGDVLPDFLLHTSAGDAVLQIDSATTDYEGAFAVSPATTPLPVEGGSIRARTLPSATAGGFSTWFEYKPTDTSKPPIHLLIYGSSKAADSPLDTEAFRRLADAPGFTALATLLNPATPASTATVRQRHQLEDRIATETAGVLPPGFRLKLSPAAPATLELIGPNGVNTFQWDGSPNSTDCRTATLCYRPEIDGVTFRSVDPDGKPRMGVYEYTPTGAKAPAGTVYLTVAGKPGVGAYTNPSNLGRPDSEPAPQGPGLTPQQARAILGSPGVAQVIRQVNTLISS